MISNMFQLAILVPWIMLLTFAGLGCSVMAYTWCFPQPGNDIDDGFFVW